ncbi:MAG: hypothetical protein ABSF14_23800 [Terriglobia bacterium]|jgi:hypothetical protein
MNNAIVRIQGQLANVDKLNENISTMGDLELNQLEMLVKAEIKLVKTRIDLVKVLSGKQIGKKAFDDIQNHQEFIDARIAEELVFTSQQKKTMDVDGKIVYRTVYSDIEVSQLRGANRAIVNDDKAFDGLSLKIKKYSSREDNGKQHMNALRNILHAINKRRTDDEIKILEAKDTKNVKLGEWARKIFKSNQVQVQPPQTLQVEVPPITA